VVCPVLWYIPHMPDNRGRFQNGEHWRKPQPFWERAWLYREYVTNMRSAADIAASQGCTENNILFWLKKHGIQTRTVSEIRSMKHWGVSGDKNPMYGVRDERHRGWKGGKASRPQGRVEYVAWRNAVIERCSATCVSCGTGPLIGKSLHAHHLLSWREFPNMRFNHDNGVVMCASCHSRLHAQTRKNGRFVRQEGGS